jgi:hypothetical protein
MAPTSLTPPVSSSQVACCANRLNPSKQREAFASDSPPLAPGKLKPLADLVERLRLASRYTAPTSLPERLAVAHIQRGRGIDVKSEDQQDGSGLAPVLLQLRIWWAGRSRGWLKKVCPAPVNSPTGAEGMPLGQVIEKARQMSMAGGPLL